MKKNKKTFSQRAKDILRLEPDPALQKGLLNQLMQEQEQYKQANGLGEQPQMANGGKIPNENPYEEYLNRPGQPVGQLEYWKSKFIDKRGYLNAILDNPQLRREGETDSMINDALNNKDNQLSRISNELKKKPQLRGNPVDVDGVTYANGGNLPKYDGIYGTSFMPMGQSYQGNANPYFQMQQQQYNQFGYQPGFEGQNGMNPFSIGSGGMSRIGGVPNMETSLNPVTANQNAAYMNSSNPMMQNPQNLTVGQQQIPQQDSGSGMGNGWQSAASFGIQSAPSIVSGITNYFGNKDLAAKSRARADELAESNIVTSAQQVEAAKYNLGSERADIRSMSRENRAAMNRAMAQSGGSRGGMKAGMVAGATKNQQTTGRQLSASRQKEALMNQQAKTSANNTNARLRQSNDAANAQRYMQAQMMADRWRQQELAYKQGQYGAITGTMSDMTKIAGQNQMINTMGDRYGYEPTNWYTPNQRQINYTGR